MPTTEPRTLLQLAGASLQPARLGDAALVLIDLQNEYLDGPLALPEAGPAIAKAALLLEAARQAGTPIVHIAHRGAAGGLFDRALPRGAIVAELTPREGETVVEKGLPNAFAGTALDAVLKATGRRELILGGFMTHMCVSATARAGLDHGYRVTVCAEACATRALPSPLGGVLDHRQVHEVALAELADRFAVIARGAAEIVGRDH